MSDLNELTTNQKIAELLKQQTYDERMEVADWLADLVREGVGEKADMDSGWFASVLGSWADGQLEVADEDATP